jgi:carboxymuconolactone decarboxylase family protein
MDRHQTVLQDLREPTRTLRHAIPDTWAGFQALHAAAMQEGCIAYHAKAAARAGASPEEVAELLGVALLMDGGTASVYAPRAWEAFLEFSAPAA